MRSEVEKVILCAESVDAGIDPRSIVSPDVDVSGKTLRVYSIAHKGRISPYIVGIGRKVLEFSERALHSVLDGLAIHTPAMKLHEPDRVDPLDHAGRPVLASVVGKALRRIGNELHACCVLAFDDQAQASAYPTISMESKKFFFGADSVVRAIASITGLALLPPGVKPAFPQAAAYGDPVLASVYGADAVLCNYVNDPNVPTGSIMADGQQQSQGDQIVNNQQPTGGQVGTPINAHSAREYIHREGIAPSRVFDTNDIIGEIDFAEGGVFTMEGGDKRVADILKKKFKGKRVVAEDEFVKMQKAAEEYEKISPAHAAYRKTDFIGKAKAKIPELAKARGLSEAAQKYLLSAANLALVEPSDDIDAALAKYVDATLEQRKAYIADGILPPDAPGKGDGSQSPASSGGTGGGTPNANGDGGETKDLSDLALDLPE